MLFRKSSILVEFFKGGSVLDDISLIAIGDKAYISTI